MQSGYTSGALAKLPNARLIGSDRCQFHHVMTDSRLISEGSQLCFFALRGSRNDGHRYLQKAYDAGVRCFVIEDESKVIQDPNAAFIVVPNTVKALQQLASQHRANFQGEVLGITGSNGKTIVKEWLYELLSADLRITRNPRSYNSQIGVPISVWNLQNEDELGIFEAGISMPGEMEALERVIQPSSGIFTHLGEAHLENFESQRQLAEEKCRLFVHCERVYGRADQPEILQALLSANFQGHWVSWSADPEVLADLVLLHHERGNAHSKVRLAFRGEELAFELPFTETSLVHNWLSCALFLLDRRMPPQLLAERSARLRYPELRMERVRGLAGSTIITDVWNSDLYALQLALQELQHVKDASKRIAVLSDLELTGHSDEHLRKELKRMLTENAIDALVGIGPWMMQHAEALGLPSTTFADTEHFIQSLNDRSFAGAAVLLKGGSKYRFDLIVRRIQRMAHASVLEINLNHLAANLNFYRSKVGPGVKVMAMVKAFGYGTGSAELASYLEYHRIDYLGVAYVQEGRALREAGIRTPIFVLNPDVAAMGHLVRHHLEPEVYSYRILRALEDELERNPQQDPYPIHIKIDTGMHRLGFMPDEVPELLNYLRNKPQLKVQGILSHLAASSSPELDGFTRTQIFRLQEAAKSLEAALGYPVLKHIANTAGLLRFPEARMDMVRLGIGLYGVSSCNEDRSRILPVGSLKTSISQLRTVPANDGIGYGQTDVAAHPRRIATIPLGYADGYPIQLSNGKGFALLNGQEVAVVGRVCMDMTMLDVTGVECHEGDEVLLFGEHPSPESLARAAGTIAYDLLSGISTRVRRIYLYE